MVKARIVVKIGSSSVTNIKGEVDEDKLSDHAAAAAELVRGGHEVLIVSSGAVAAGFRKLGYPSRPVTLKGRQAAAAVGQSLLIQSYYEEFGKYGMVPAQILLTRNDFSNQARYKNAYATLSELLERGIIPIINENDTVSVEELTFGDNDMLSALVSGLIHADRLIILTDINGLYDANPHTNPDASRIDSLDQITDEWLRAAEGAGSKVGTGGMRSKLTAARTALSLGVKVFIGSGTGRRKLLDILEGNGDGTYIGGKEAIPAVNTRKQWLFLHSDVSGSVSVDKGAENALLEMGSSLLPAGIKEISGSFSKGEVVEVYGPSGLLGRGEASCSAEDLAGLLRNRKRKDEQSAAFIHRDQWVRI